MAEFSTIAVLMRKMMYGVCYTEPDCLLSCLHHICMSGACNLIVVRRAKAECWLLRGRLGKCRSSSACLGMGQITSYTFLNGLRNKCESEANWQYPFSRFYQKRESFIVLSLFQSGWALDPVAVPPDLWRSLTCPSVSLFWISIKLAGIQRKDQCTFCSFFIWKLNDNDLQCYKL